MISKDILGHDLSVCLIFHNFSRLICVVIGHELAKSSVPGSVHIMVWFCGQFVPTLMGCFMEDSTSIHLGCYWVLSDGHYGVARLYPHRLDTLVIPSIYFQNLGVQILSIYDELFKLLHEFIVLIFVFDDLLMSLYNDFNQRNLFSMTICKCIFFCKCIYIVYVKYFYSDYRIAYSLL